MPCAVGDDCEVGEEAVGVRPLDGVWPMVNRPSTSASRAR